MRRKDREMPVEFGLEVIDRASYGVLSLVNENGEPYGVPLSIVRDGNTLYFHSAQDGSKVKALAGNNLVSVAFVGEVSVPELYSNRELNEIVKDENEAGLLLSRVFTTEFESAIVKGRVELVEDKDEKVKAMKLVCQKHTPTKMAYFPLAVEAELPKANVYRIVIEEIKAKRKRYDSTGEEMKWARME